MAGIDIEKLAQINTQKDELGKTGRAFTNLINYFTEMTQAAERIKDGNFSVQVSPCAENDLLGNAFKQIVTNLRQLVGKVSKTANDVDPPNS